MSSVSKLLTACLMFFATAALAIENDHIRGEVLAVDEEQGKVNIEILETGDAVKAKIGAVETFMISDPVEIEVELKARPGRAGARPGRALLLTPIPE